MRFMKFKEAKGTKKWLLIIACVFLFITFDIVMLCANMHFVNSTTDISKYHKNIDMFDDYKKAFNFDEKLVIFPRELKDSK